MDIAAISTGLSQMKMAQQASISVMKIAMDTVKGQSEDLTKILNPNNKILQQSINPHLGASLDVIG